MARLIRFIHNKKEYVIPNYWVPIIKDKIATEENCEIIIIQILKSIISHCNRSEAQKERWKKQKEYELLGIPYMPKTKKNIETEPPKPVNLNGGLFKINKS